MGLDSVVIILDAEKKFGIDIVVPDRSIVTAGDFYASIVACLARKGPVDIDEVWREVTIILGRAVRKEPGSIRMEHRLYEDLGLN